MGNENRMRSRKNKFLLILLTFFFLVLCIGISGGATLYSYLSGFSKNLNKDSNGVKPYAAKSKDEPVNILVMGVDVGTVGVKEEDNRQRTDTIIVMNYDPKTGAVNLISVPRDTLIMIKGKKQKINAANAIGGTSYLIEAVEKMLDLKINYYGKVDYSGFRELVDIIGGVDIKIPFRMDYDDSAQNLHIHFKKGEVVHLDGKKAEEFFRWRKNNDGTGLADGDLGRIENQHLFIEKVMDKFKSLAILHKVPAILQAIPKYAETNMDPEAILKYGSAVLTADKSNIKMMTLQGDAADIDGVSYIIYNEKKNDKLISAIHRKE
jgi:polyisoprenyl-teichoic acid--peptidoglycan teichoic acid transferase